MPAFLPPSAARLLTLALLGCAAAGCTQPAPTPAALRPTDTGSMAYPTPLPQGNLTTTGGGSLRPTDVGSMAYPTPQPQGNLNTTSTSGQLSPTDTGSMADQSPQQSRPSRARPRTRTQ